MHDLRRSATRALQQAGVHKIAIMEMGESGSMFDGSAIVSNDDTLPVLARLPDSRQVHLNPSTTPLSNVEGVDKKGMVQ